MFCGALRFIHSGLEISIPREDLGGRPAVIPVDKPHRAISQQSHISQLEARLVPETVLLVDDSTEDNFIHRRQLRRHYPEAEVFEAKNGREGLDFLRSRAARGHGPVDLIFLDVNMPVLDAWGFLEEYDALPAGHHARHLGLMVSTALPSTARAIAETSDHVTFFISKPFDTGMLDETLRKLG